MAFLFVFFFWDSYDSNVGAFHIVPEVPEIVLISFDSERLNVTNIDEDVEKQVFAHIPAEVQIMYSPFRNQTVSIYYNFKCLHSPPRYSLPGR